jgi:two-component system sensor histidine kinase KdpD
MSDDGRVTDPADAESGALSRSRVYGGWALAVIGTAALTGALIPFRQGPAPTFEAMLYLALAVASALVGGRWPALAASVIGTLALNYFFTEPVHTLAVASAQNVVTLSVFVVVSVAVASVVDSAARRRQQASLARAEANTLGMLNRTVLGGEYDVPRLLDLVRDTFGAESAELAGNDAEVPVGATAARATKQSLLVLRGRSLSTAEQRILAAFASHVGVLREREELARQTAAARELEAGNRTRTALLAAVSHDLRTPLAGIRAAAETLRSNHDRLTVGDRTDLLLAIEQATGRLTTLVADLLDMSRLQTGAVQPVFTEVGLDDVVRQAAVGLGGADRLRAAGPLPDVRADVGLLERVVANLVSNALRHTDGAVEVAGARNGPRVRLSVVDHGPGVPVEQRTRMFEPFQRLGDHGGEGVGLGLAVARGLAEAQGGTLVVEDTPGGGLTMVLELAGTG